MEVAPSVDEIDISDERSLQLVLDFLEKYFFESLHLWQLLKYIQQNLITKEHMWPHQLLIDDRRDIKCVIFIYGTIGFIPNYQSLTEEEKSRHRCVTFFCDIKDDHLLVPLIQHYVPWSKIKAIAFSVIQQRFSPVIKNFIHDNNVGQCVIDSYQQMVLDKTTFEKKSKNITSSHLSDIIVRPLSVSDASIVNDLWKYKTIRSLDQIKYQIAHLPTYGAYRNNELISWSLTQYNGSVGTVFTKPEARGLGLATILNVHIALKLFENQEQVYCFVAHDNIPSMRMLEKLGYHRTCDVDWLIFMSE